MKHHTIDNKQLYLHVSWLTKWLACLLIELDTPVPVNLDLVRYPVSWARRSVNDLPEISSHFAVERVLQAYFKKVQMLKTCSCYLFRSHLLQSTLLLFHAFLYPFILLLYIKSEQAFPCVLLTLFSRTSFLFLSSFCPVQAIGFDISWLLAPK